MGKGGGGGGGRKNSGGVGGRSAGGGGLSPGAKRALLALGLGAYYAAGAAGLATAAADPEFRAEFAGAFGGAAAAANAAARKVLPITKTMRDKVREWSIARASRARGEVQTEGVAMAAARAALNGESAVGKIPKAAAARGWRDIPDNSVFSTRTGSFRGRDIKSLVREAVAAQKNHIANAPQLEASTAARSADKARGLAASVRGSTKGKRQARNLSRAKKAMKKS